MSYYEIDNRIYLLHTPILGSSKLSNAEGKRKYRAQAIADLQTILKPGQEVSAIVRKVAPSGMSRTISLYIVDYGSIKCIDYTAALALDWPDANPGIRVTGCGMDMCFHTVYTLGHTLGIELTQRHM